MQLNWIEIFAIFAFNIILVILLINFVYKRRKVKQNQQQEIMIESHIEQKIESCTINKVPKEIVIGADPLKPAVTIKQLESYTEYEKATPLDINTQPISKMNELFNVVPSLLIAGEIHGKKIMEVIIDGELVRASDGNGFRAFVMEGNRIKEQAKLYEPTNFKSLINAAAVWQIASVIVAQKH